MRMPCRDRGSRGIRPDVRRLAWIALAGSLLLGSPAIAGDAEPDKSPVTPLHGILRGATMRMEPFFRWQPKPETPWGILGEIVGTTKEFEAIEVEVGADRMILTATERAAYEAYRIKRDVEKGEAQAADVKPDMTIVRLKNPFRDGVYATAIKQLGRTTVYVRGKSSKKDEAGLVRVLKAIAAGITTTADDVDGWIPSEVRTAWTKTPSADYVISDDGTLDAERKAAALKVVREAQGLVKRFLGVSYVTSSPPVVRVTANRDLFAHLAGSLYAREADAAYLPWVGELIVSPRAANKVDAPSIARAAATQAVHYALGTAEADPVRTGLERQAAYVAAGGEADPSAHSELGRALQRIKDKQAKTWYRLLMATTLVGFLSEDADERRMDAELAVGYLASPGASVGKASLAAWVAAVRKSGHPDAGAEAAVGAMDPSKSDAEYWAYWNARAEPPPKKK